MSARHTPGPWAVSPDHIFRNQGDIFEIHWSDIGECVSECVHGSANARLIAAAPDLLFALQRLVDNVDGGEFISITRIEEARAAIAKATGGAT